MDDLTAAIADGEHTLALARAQHYLMVGIPAEILGVLLAAARASQEAAAERVALIDVLRRNGFVPCDIPACNCGSWHARYGLPERWEEIKDALAEADHPLCNANGNSTFRALHELVAERDALRKDAERWRDRATHAAHLLDAHSLTPDYADEAQRLIYEIEDAAIAASAPDKGTT